MRGPRCPAWCGHRGRRGGAWCCQILVRADEGAGVAVDGRDDMRRRASASHQSSLVGLEARPLPHTRYPPCATAASSFSMLPKPRFPEHARSRRGGRGHLCVLRLKLLGKVTDRSGVSGSETRRWAHTQRSRRLDRGWVRTRWELDESLSYFLGVTDILHGECLSH
jgi:hypothetical protein